MWHWMVVESVRVRLRSIITGVIGVPASRCLVAVTRIGIVTPGGVLVICLTSCVATTSSRHSKPGNGCVTGHSSKRRWVVLGWGCGCGWGLSLASVPTDRAAGVRDGSGKWWWGVVVGSWAAVSTRGWGRGPARRRTHRRGLPALPLTLISITHTSTIESFPPSGIYLHPMCFSKTF